MSLFPVWYHRWISKRSDWRKAKELVWSFLRRKIEAAHIEAETKDIDSATCVVDLIARLERQDSLKNKKLTMEAFTDELFVYMVAVSTFVSRFIYAACINFYKGTETTAIALRWLVKFLADNPHVQRKLHKELVQAGIPSAFDDAPLPSFADLYSEKVAYLDAVSSEAMRVSKVTNITEREGKQETSSLFPFCAFSG